MNENITLSDLASQKLREIIANDTSKTVLRITVDTGGCFGFQYRFDLDSHIKEDDLVFEDNGAKLVVDPLSFELTKGSQVDYIDELIGSSFVLNNPNSSSSCGCGSSFSV